MAGVIYYEDESGKLVRMESSPYDSEDVLQGLLAEHPDLLAGEEMDQSAPRRWLLIRREMGVPPAEGEGDWWSVDHLFVDQDGVPTLVEVKRSGDTRARREVVAQMLDYAAHAANWPVDRLRTLLERSTGDGTSAVDEFLGPDREASAFWQDVKTNLQAGRVRMVFVADRISPELRQIVEFLNEQMDPAEVFAVEVRLFTGDGRRAFVPRVVGQTAAAQRRKGRGPSGRQWDEASFFEAIESSRGPGTAAAARRILRWATERRLRIWWGRGASFGSFFPLLDHAGNSHFTVGVWTNGGVEFQFQHILKRPAFADEADRLEYCRRLEEIDGVVIPRDRIAARPSIDLSLLDKPEPMNRFLAVLDWYLESVRRAGA